MNNPVGLNISRVVLDQKKRSGSPEKSKKISKLTNKQKEMFYLELYSMLEAGMDLKKALEVFINIQKKESDKKLFEQISQNLINGKSLFQCMEMSKSFTPYEYYCIQIGEESGRQLKVLKDLSNYFSNKLKIRKQLVKSLSYPIVILITSIVAVSFMMAFIVPMFTDIFKRFNGDLPFLTKFFIKLSGMLTDYFLLIVAVIAAITMSVIYFLKDKKNIQRLQRIYPKIPYLGELISSIYNARFCSSMSLLIGAKVPLINALQLVNKMVDYYPIQVGLTMVEKDVLKGSSFHESLSKQKIFDEKVIAMIRIGEEVNKMEVFFDKLHERFMDEVDVRTNALNTFLEPLIIVLLGLVIGVILVAMYMPMFKLSTSMSM